MSTFLLKQNRNTILDVSTESVTSPDLYIETETKALNQTD